MGVCTFEQGAIVKIDRVEHRLVRKISSSLWQLENVRSGALARFEHNELLRMYAEKALVFPSQGDVSHCGPANSALSPQDHEIAVLRLAYVRATLTIPNTRLALEQCILELWKEIKQPAKAPGYATVYLWKRKFQQANQDYRVLVDRTNRKGNRTRRFQPEVLDLCSQAIEAKYLQRERNTIEKTVEEAVIRVKQANKLRLPGMQLPYPTRRLMTRLVQSIPAYDKCAARYGSEIARKTFRSVKGHITASEPLERAEIDHTQLDIIVVDDETSDPISGRPYVTACIDVFSRCVLGIYVGFNPPGYQTVQLCLKDCLSPKVRLKRDYPVIRSEWAAHGRMHKLVVDGGLEFHGTSLEQMCNSCGIEIDAAPRRTPWYKGVIERFLGTLNRAVTEGVPGTTFRSIAEKGDYDSTKHACVTLSTLKTNIMQWIADGYHQRPHSTIGTTPAQMWASGITPEMIGYGDESTHLDALLGSAHQRTVTHAGIKFEGLSYNCDGLRALRRAEGTNLKVEIRVNESDIGLIYVLWPTIAEPIEVPAVESDYAKGRSLWAHKVIQKRQRDNSDIDQGANGRLQVSQDIARRIAEDASLKRKRSSKRAQRFREGTDQTRVGRDARQATSIHSRGSSILDLNNASMVGEPYSPVSQLDGATALCDLASDDSLPNFTARYRNGYGNE